MNIEPNYTIRIICDQSKTRHHIVEVLGYFEEIGIWVPVTRSRNATAAPSRTEGTFSLPGKALLGSTPYDQAQHSGAKVADTRFVFEMQCATCKTVTVTAREDSLSAVMDDLRHAGRDSVVLRELATTLSSKHS